MGKWDDDMQKWAQRAGAGEKPERPNLDVWQIDGDRAYNPATGQNAAWDNETGAWIDVKTGQSLTTPLVVK